MSGSTLFCGAMAESACAPLPDTVRGGHLDGHAAFFGYFLCSSKESDCCPAQGRANKPTRKQVPKKRRTTKTKAPATQVSEDGTDRCCANMSECELCESACAPIRAVIRGGHLSG